MALATIHASFEASLREPVRVFEELATTKTFRASHDFTTDDLCLLEGVLSRIWQVWCGFCRQVVVDSCLGTSDLAGPIPALSTAVSDAHVSSAAILAARGRTVTWTGQNTVLRLEPTWGRIDVMLDIISGLAPANAVKLNGMCAVASSSAKVLHAARNSASHNNAQTLAELRRLSSPYSAFAANHACESLFWIEATSGDYLLPRAVQELKDAADFAVI